VLEVFKVFILDPLKVEASDGSDASGAVSTVRPLRQDMKSSRGAGR
jgi:hypothetical protein